MNKIAKITAGLFLTMALVACGDSKQDVVTYGIEQPGVSVQMTLYGENDKIVKQVTKSTIEYSAIGAENKEQAKEILSIATNNVDYSALKGVTYSMNYGDSSATENIDIDLTKADLKELSALPGSAFEGNPENGISMKATEMLLEQSGFSKVE
ncbi:YehR family lipoprotein [Ignatzschineria sp. LJL83]